MAGEAAEQIGLEGTVNMENEDRSVIYTNTRNVIETGILTGSINLWPVVIVSGGAGVLIVILSYIYYAYTRAGKVQDAKDDGRGKLRKDIPKDRYGHRA